MPPRKKADQVPLCAEHFPYGLGEQPADATVVSCAHGSWNVADIKPATPADPGASSDPGDSTETLAGDGAQ